MLAAVFAWGPPAYAAGPGKRDAALEKHLRSASQAEYRVIIEMVDHRAQSADLATKLAGGRKIRGLVSFPGAAVTVTAKQLALLERHPLVKAVYLDRPTEGQLAYSGFTTGAALARAFLGYTGAGVGVAVIDSGVTGWHDDLTTGGAGQRVAAFVDFVQDQPVPYDDYGHGTHVAGVIAGNGHDSYGVYSGVAPKANIIGLKVLDGAGAGYMSDVIAAIDWAIANRDAHNIRVINLSVGAPVTQSYLTDPLTLAAKRAVDAGVIVVAAAGNRGKNAAGEIQFGGVTAPGNAPWVITVGNANTGGTVWRWDDTIANSSSRGPSAIDFGAKPDLVAPGTGIVSLNAPGSTLALQRPGALINGSRGVQPAYIAMSGTSMAAPAVSGTIALMLEANPNLTPNLAKAILQYTAESRTGIDPLAQGAGFLNAFGAVNLAARFANPQYPLLTTLNWSRHLIWGNHMISGGELLPGASAWALNIVWGTLARDGDNIVWGTILRDGDNIVWGTILRDGDNIVWGTLADGDNIVWGTLAVDGDNIVWGTTAGPAENVVWGTDCGGSNCSSVVWGTVAEGDNIVWGTAEAGDNIVWGTAADGDNIVWGTAADGDNIVWGTSDDTDILGSGASDLIENLDTTDPLAAVETMFEMLFTPVVSDGTVGGLL
jgi:serine protease AprX